MTHEQAIERFRPIIPGVEEFHVDPERDPKSWHALRMDDATASQSPCLICEHDYITPRELFELKKGRLPDPEETPAMLRGKLMEPVAVRYLCKEYPTWKFFQPSAYFRHKTRRMGATPDLFAVDPEREGFGIIQIKNPGYWAFRSKWLNSAGAIEAPTWIAIQALQEADLTGASWAAVAPFRTDNGLDIDLIDVPIHRGVLSKLQDEVADFWHRFEMDDPPPFDYRRDGDLIEDRFVPKHIVDMSDDKVLYELALERDVLSSGKSSAEKRLKEIKAQILVRLPNVNKARIADGRVISITRIPPKTIPATERSSYIDLRILAGGKK